MNPDSINLSARQVEAALFLYGFTGLGNSLDSRPIRQGSSRAGGPKMAAYRAKRKKKLKIANKSRKVNRLRKAA